MIRTYKSTKISIPVKAHLGALLNQIPSILFDGKTKAWHSPLESGYVENYDSSGGIVWHDLTNRKNNYGEILDSGTTVIGKVYKIVASTSWYFGVESNINDYFICTSEKALDSTHKVKELLGGFVYQSSNDKVPVNGISDGEDDYMKSIEIAELVQPITIYAVMKQITWSGGDVLIDGGAVSSGLFWQQYSANQVNLRAGTAGFTNDNFELDTWAIVQLTLNGSDSKIKINNGDETSGDIGTNDMLGVTYFRYGDSNSAFSNAAIKEAIFRSGDTVLNSDIFDYLSNKYFNVKKVALLGDSITDVSGDYVHNFGVYNLDNLGVSGAKVSLVKSTWEALSSVQKSSYDYIFIMCGLNNSVEPLAETLGDYQSLIDQVNIDRKSGSTLIGAIMTPAGSSVNWTGNTTLWNNINDAIQGLGTTPLSGFDSVLTSHSTTLNDGSDNLLSEYDNGDGIHPNTAGRVIIAGIYAGELPNTK